MSKPEIRFVGDLQRVEVKPGDKFVLKLPGHCTEEVAARLRAHASEFLDGAPVLILADGVELGVIGAAD